MPDSVSARSPDGKYVEIVEAPEHPWFLGCSSIPSFKIEAVCPRIHFFLAFIGAALAHRQREKRRLPRWKHKRVSIAARTSPSN